MSANAGAATPSHATGVAFPPALHALRWELIVQTRRGFWYAAALMGFTTAFALAWLDTGPAQQVMPAVAVGNLIVGTFFFAAALILLERDEGSLLTLATSPLGLRRLILLRGLALAILALVETGIIVLLGLPMTVERLWFVPAVLASAVPLCWLGIGLAARLPSVNRFLLPSVGVLTLISAPLVTSMLGLEPLWAWLFPLQPAIALAEFAAGDPPDGRLWGALVAGGLWAVPAWRYAVVGLERLVASQVDEVGA